MWNDFKKFAVKGNVMDLAIGVIIGSAFGKIVTSLVNDLIMPIMGLLLGGIDFSRLSITIGDAVVRYGAFIQTVVDFLIISFSIFFFIQFLSRLKKKEDVSKEEPPVIDRKEKLLEEILEELKNNYSNSL